MTPNPINPAFADMPASPAMTMLLALLKEVVTASGGQFDETHFHQPVIGFVSALYTDAWVTGAEFSLSMLADWMSSVDPERWGVLRKETPKMLEMFKGQFENSGWKYGLL